MITTDILPFKKDILENFRESNQFLYDFKTVSSKKGVNVDMMYHI